MTTTTKQLQVEALQAILPETAEVSDMLKAWRGADQRYWGGNLLPCWLTSNIEPYGHCIGTWNEGTRTLNLIPSLWRDAEGNRRPPEDTLEMVAGVMVHEACHQAQRQIYADLDTATGPKTWTDTSHRCPSWSRACEDVIQAEGLPWFMPVWHRSTGNQWNPWVPASSDWMTWRKVEPDATFDGRKLIPMMAARCFLGKSTLTLSELIESLGFPTLTPKGKPIDWTL